MSYVDGLYNGIYYYVVYEFWHEFRQRSIEVSSDLCGGTYARALSCMMT